MEETQSAKSISKASIINAVIIFYGLFCNVLRYKLIFVNYR